MRQVFCDGGGDEFVQNDEKEHGKDHLRVHHPVGNRLGLFGGLAVDGLFGKGGVGGEAKGPDAESHSLAEGAQAAKDGVFKERVLFAHAGDGFFFHDDFAIGFAYGDAIAVRRAHHYALHDGLTADEGFLTAFEHGEHLDMGEKTKSCSDGQEKASKNPL